VGGEREKERVRGKNMTEAHICTKEIVIMKLI
jgi:hypothetical protein